MTDEGLPPDPWAEDEVDLWALEASEKLVHDGADPDDPRWEHLGGEPTIDAFDEADAELADREHAYPAGDSETSPFRAMAPWMSLIAAIVAAAVFALYVLR